MNIFEQHGINNPTEANFDNILRPELASKGKKTGQPALKKTIKKGLSLAKRFYAWKQSKGDFQMNDNETMNEELKPNNQPASYQEATTTQDTPFPPTNNLEPETQPARRLSGRPRTGRTEKFTLYMSAEAMEDLTMLTEAYSTNITELLNKLIDNYRATQTRQITFLKKQKQEFINTFANKEK